MVIYTPHHFLPERIKQAEIFLQKIPARYCFITGSFLYQQHYNDIDIFVLSRTKQKLIPPHPKAKITIIDFNDLSSLFYHSITKSGVAKNILPIKSLKVTLSDYWQVINEAVPTIMNQKDKYRKEVRFLILYTQYFKTKQILDSYELAHRINQFKNYHDLFHYINKEVPPIISNHNKRSYLKRFFYTQAGFYKNAEYKAQNFLYELSHAIVRSYGQPIRI